MRNLTEKEIEQSYEVVEAYLRSQKTWWGKIPDTDFDDRYFSTKIDDTFSEAADKEIRDRICKHITDFFTHEENKKDMRYFFDKGSIFFNIFFKIVEIVKGILGFKQDDLMGIQNSFTKFVTQQEKELQSKENRAAELKREEEGKLKAQAEAELKRQKEIELRAQAEAAELDRKKEIVLNRQKEIELRAQAEAAELNRKKEIVLNRQKEIELNRQREIELRAQAEAAELNRKKEIVLKAQAEKNKQAAVEEKLLDYKLNDTDKQAIIDEVSKILAFINASLGEVGGDSLQRNYNELSDILEHLVLKKQDELALITALIENLKNSCLIYMGAYDHNGFVDPEQERQLQLSIDQATLNGHSFVAPNIKVIFLMMKNAKILNDYETELFKYEKHLDPFFTQVHEGEQISYFEKTKRMMLEYGQYERAISGVDGQEKNLSIENWIKEILDANQVWKERKDAEQKIKDDAESLEKAKHELNSIFTGFKDEITKKINDLNRVLGPTYETGSEAHTALENIQAIFVEVRAQVEKHKNLILEEINEKNVIEYCEIIAGYKAKISAISLPVRISKEAVVLGCEDVKTGIKSWFPSLSEDLPVKAKQNNNP